MSKNDCNEDKVGGNSYDEHNKHTEDFDYYTKIVFGQENSNKCK